MDSHDEEAPDPSLYERISAYVFSLVSAIGGSSAEDDGRYRVGDEALQCLRDIRKVVTAYDIKANRLDVARVASEANLVKGDLLEILAQWPEDANPGTLSHRTVIAALEILVHLTWPFEIEPEDMTINHHRHLPILQLAQSGYKQAILRHESAKILHTAIRAALPSMAEARKERTLRDESIIKIVLCLIRNVAAITQASKTPSEVDDSEISRSATIDVFQQQDVFQLILAMSSSMGDEFVSQDVIILETLFHLLKGVNVEKLFMDDQKLAGENTKDFKMLLNKEKSMLAGYARHAPTRHNRFGTMIWVKRDDYKVSTVSGQDVLGNAQKTMLKMDKTKKWNKPKNRGRKKEDLGTDRTEFDRIAYLDGRGRKNLRTFAEEFLDTSFNPLFSHLRKAIEREESRVEGRHSAQFFYVVSWFLQAECVRRRKIKEVREKSKGATSTANSEDESFGLIAGVMTQETFVLLNRFMQRSQDDKTWQDLKAGMRAFTQILLTVQEMSESPLEDDQEIAENILNRIFYEESTHERVITILRNYKEQGFGYLDAVTELSHVFLRMLERYSKQNVDLQVRSKRRARKKKKQAEGETDVGEDGIVDRAEEAEDVAEAQRTVSERKFDFTRFAARFLSQGCVDTFIKFLKFYNDLNAEQLKRAHRFLYRLAFKMELGVYLYRVDILHLFNKMIKGPEGLDPEQSNFKEWEELVRQVFRRMTKKIQERPELVVEMLFSKINATMFYLEHGYEKEILTRAPRPPAELEVKPGMEKPEEIGVAVAVLLNQSKADALQWIKDSLSSAAEERKSWEDAEVARKALARSAAPAAPADDLDELMADNSAPPAQEPDNTAPPITLKPDSEERRLALFKDNKLRLLLTLLGFERQGAAEDSSAPWLIPSSLSANALTEALDLVRKFERDPPSFDEGKSAESYLRSKAAARRARAEFDDESGNDDDGEEEFMFPAGGPTAMKKSEALAALEKIRRKRQRRGSDVELDEETKDARAAARRAAELAKRMKIKSQLHVYEEDDLTDEEADADFFEREAELRMRTRLNIVKALERVGDETQETQSQSQSQLQSQGTKRKKGGETAKGRKNKRRRSEDLSDEDDVADKTTDDEEDALDSATASESEAESLASSTASAASTVASPRPQNRRTSKSKEPPSKLKQRLKKRLPAAIISDPPSPSSPEPSAEANPPAESEDADADKENQVETLASKLALHSDTVMLSDDEEEDVPVARAPVRKGPAMRGGFVLDDSDDE